MRVALDKAIHELEVHQIELEAQNEELRTVQLALEKARSEYVDLYDFAPVGYFTVSGNGKILNANQTSCAMLSVTKANMIGHGFGLYVAADDIQTWEQYRLATLKQRYTTSCELTMRRNDDSTFYARLDGKGMNGSLLLAVTDISIQKQMYENRTDILFAVSHELKTPLMLLSQSKEMMESSPEKWANYSKIWIRNLQRLERMINNLVDSQRTNTHVPIVLELCEPNDTLNTILDDLQPYALAQSVKITLSAKQIPSGLCDHEAFGRVIENLLTNAIKFSRRRGLVDVRLSLDKDTLLFEVEDHGVGIAKDEMMNLFQPFQRTKHTQKRGTPGTGLGLYVSHKIVTSLGGTIQLKSLEGKGTIVTVCIPWVKAC